MAQPTLKHPIVSFLLASVPEASRQPSQQLRVFAYVMCVFHVIV